MGKDGITNVLLSGVGGQGILTASRLLAMAALHRGLDVKMSEVHGMSQRGGNVDTHVRIGEAVPSPMIPKGGAHFLVSFEKLEALRYLDYLRPDGVAFVNRLEISPLTLALKQPNYVDDVDRILDEKAPHIIWVDGTEMARELGDVRMVNVIMLGALATRLPFLEEADWEAAVKERFKKAKVQQAVLGAFRKGAEACPSR
jgi:indolepyruvate ferredoxin oxidoreductase beta subunit